jgi:hypothetical protein
MRLSGLFRDSCDSFNATIKNSRQTMFDVYQANGMFARLYNKQRLLSV